METEEYPCVLAQWTHEAAREGRARFIETACIKEIQKDPCINETQYPVPGVTSSCNSLSNLELA